MLISNITNVWVNVNTTLGITIGKSLLLTNIGNNPMVVIVMDVQPNQTDLGKPLTTVDKSYAEIVVTNPQHAIWVKGVRDVRYHTTLMVEDIS